MVSEEAYALLSKSPFFGAWDQDVLRSYVEYALTEDSSGQVRLKCMNIQVPAHATDQGWGFANDKKQEAAVFADGTRSIEAWSALPQIDSRISMKWILPRLEESVLGSYELAEEAVWRRPENTTNSVLSRAAHLVSLIGYKGSFLWSQTHVMREDDTGQSAGSW